MRDASFTAPPKRNFAQRALDRGLEPYRHLSNIWKDREGLQRMELDPEYIHNRSLASKGPAPRYNLDYNMIVNPGHHPGDSYIQLGYGGGTRDRFLGALAGAAVIGGGGGGLIKSVPALQKLNTLRKVGIPAWTIAGGVAAGDAAVGKISDLTKLRKRDIYKSFAKDIFPMDTNKYTDFSRNVGKAVGLGGGVGMSDKKNTETGSGSLLSSLIPNYNDNSSEGAIKRLIIGLGLASKNKSKEGFLSFAKQILQKTNPGYLITRFGLDRVGRSLTDRGTKVLKDTPIKQIAEDLATGDMSKTEVIKALAGLASSGKLPENLPSSLKLIIDNLDREGAINGLKTLIPSKLPSRLLGK